MRGTDRMSWRRAAPGLAILAGLVGLAALIFFLDEARRKIEEGPRLFVLVESAPELEPGSAVWVAGRPAGRVVSVRFRNPQPGGHENVLVESVLRRGVERVLRRDATARIERSSLLAPMVLDVRPGSPASPPYDFRDTLRGSVSLVDQDRALALLDTLRAAAESAREPAARLARALSDGTGTLASLRREPGALLDLRNRLDRLGRLLEPGARGSLAQWAADTLLAQNLERMRSSLERLSAVVDSARRTGISPADLRASIRDLQARWQRLETELAAAHGSLGRAVYDSAIYRERDLLLARLDSARTELLANPFRFLRVRWF